MRRRRAFLTDLLEHLGALKLLGAAAAALATVFLLAPVGAPAQTPSTSPPSGQLWPQRPVRFILPLGPGSATDIAARLFADRLAQRWGQPVVVENRPGGDSFVAIGAFLSANDDHTLLFAGLRTVTAHPYLHDKLPYDPREIVPVAGASNIVVAIAVPSASPPRSLADLVALARPQPGKLNAAAVPGITDFMFSGFLKNAGVNMARVPY